MTTQVIRPAGASHETLHVLWVCLLIIAVAGSVIAWHRESHEVAQLPSHQLDARRDLTPGEQGIFGDLQVALDEVALLAQEQPALPTPAQLADEGFPPFVNDASAVSRGGHQWQLLPNQAYLGLSQDPGVAGSFLVRNGPSPDVWLNRDARVAAPADLQEQALIDSGWQQVIAQYDAGVTRQHRH